jgi:hypothetical protein
MNQRPWCFPILLLLGFLTDNLSQARRECGAEFARVSAEQVHAIALVYVETLASSSSIQDLAYDNLVENAKYDVAVAKICGTCEEMAGLVVDDDSSGGEFGFGTLCAQNAYGYSAKHSALVMAPIDPSTNQIMTGLIRGMLSVCILL